MTRLMAGARNLPEKGPVISLAGVVFPDSRRTDKKTAASARERLALWREFLGSIAGTPATKASLTPLTMDVKSAEFADFLAFDWLIFSFDFLWRFLRF